MSVHDNAIVTLAAAKERLEEKSDKNDAHIEKMIDHFTSLLEREVGRPIKKRTVTSERLDGTGTPEILIHLTPVQVVTSFTINSPFDDSLITAITDTSKFFIKSARSGLVRLKEDIFTEGVGNVLFTGDVGFETTDIQFRNFEEAAYAALIDFYPRWQRRELSQVSKSYPDGTATFIAAAALPPIVRGMIRSLDFAMGI